MPVDGDVPGRRVCVIGAGVAGLVSAKVLKHDGFDVTVFEKDRTIGGVWSASRAHAGLRTNNPRETYAFSDFPHPDSNDEFPTAAQVRGYLASYARHFGLEPCLRLSTEVVSVARHRPEEDRACRAFRVTVRPMDGASEVRTHDFDHVVVCNGVFSEPHVPRLEGSEQFEGSQIHSSQLVDETMLRGKRVVIVGAGKSALDCATMAARVADSCTLVFREPYWMLPRYFGGRFRVDQLLLTRMSGHLLPTWHGATRTQARLRTLAAPLLWLSRKALDQLVRRLAGIPPAMVPGTHVTSGTESTGIGEEVYAALRQGSLTARRAGNVGFSGPREVRLDTGEVLETDVVVLATGWRQDVAFLEPGLRREVRSNAHFHLYRCILPPRERRLGFVGYASSASCTLTSEVAAHWLSACFRGELPLPDDREMDREIERVRAWTAKVFPKRPEGYFIGAYVAPYVDELLRDLGVPHHRARGALSEYLKPLWAERYRGLTEERRRLAHARSRPKTV